MRAVVLATILLLVMPLAASAAVRINEIAWMGTSANPNAEWIELHNDGAETVQLAGYALTSSTGAPTIALTGAIEASGFYLLTRTSTSIIPGVTGDQAYTGALANTGATLTLSHGSAVVDEVVGGNNWQNVGGDNATKETAQRQGSAWVTAPGTPKALNAQGSGSQEEEEEEQEPEEQATTTPVATIGGSSTTSGVATYTLPRLYLSAGGNRIVTAGAETPFTARVFDRDGRHRGARVVWAFGDGVRRVGEEVRHSYEVPGEYLVVVRASDRTTTAIRTLTVRVTEPQVSVARVPGTGVEVRNASGEILDLSRWQLLAGARRFTIPDDTAILPNGKSVFTPTVTKLPDEAAILLYPSGKEAARDAELAELAL